ncbi:hypothetical protein [Halovivax cerinus]|uniref:DUF8159 domain-containing protein n=1 Tax=Halovivax cerinus TaxID=1487865 RepID=A0ABD5NKS8_9EURY|nr:hypothetical protein [Halovivax cerinus]
MNRRTVLQVVGAATLALLGSCLDRADRGRQYQSLLDLATGNSRTDGPRTPNGGSLAPTDSAGAADSPDGGSGSPDDSSDGSGGSNDRPSAGDLGFDAEAFKRSVRSDDIERGDATADGGTLVVSFRSTADHGGEPTDELTLVLEALSAAVDDPDGFARSVDRIELVVSSPDGARRRTIDLDPTWVLAHRRGDLTMAAYLDRLRGKGGR